MNRKILIPGGNGFIGRHLVRYFREQGDRVIVLTRTATDHADDIVWDGRSLGAWAEHLNGADAVINLCGKSVNCRYTRKNRAAIFASRLESTRILGLALAQCPTPPPVWINSSSATIYRHAEDRVMDDHTGEIGAGFSVEVCRQWERELFAPELPTVRRIALRSAIVFGPGRGGPFDVFRILMRLGLGGTQGNGRQFVSWVHVRDFCRAVEWLLTHPELSGPINLAAPNPLPNRNFLADFRRQMGVPFGLPAPAPLLAIGTFFLRSESELVLKSRRVVANRLMESGFQFEFEKWPDAVADLLV